MPMPLPREPQSDEAAALDAAVDRAIAACGGDPRAAVRTFVVALLSYEQDLETLRREVEALTAALSSGYVRQGKGGRCRPARSTRTDASGGA
jgi:hypothetical protein